MTEKTLTAKQKASIASRAQATAHGVLRQRHADEYSAVYALAKKKLTDEELAKA